MNQPKRKNNNLLTRYVERAKISEAPDYMHFWAGVSLISSVVRRNVYLPMGTFDYVPNFYIIFVAPPGITKSVTMAPVAQFLREFSKQGVYLSKASTTWQEFIRSFARAQTKVTYPDSGGLALHYNAMSIIASELGTFLDFSNHDLINHLTELWDARRGKFEKGTKTMGTDVIYSPVLNMLGATTPAWIERNFETFMIGSGFTSRTIFIYAAEKSQYIAYPEQHAQALGFDIQVWEQDILHDLRIIAQLCGRCRLTSEAKEFGEELYVRIQNEITSGKLSDDLQGFYARKQSHIHKLAIILSLSERSDLVIGAHHLETAESLIETVERSRIQTLATVGQTREATIIATVRRMFDKRAKIPVAELWDYLSKRADLRSIENALNTGQRAGFWYVKGTTLYRRDSQRSILNQQSTA